MDLSAARANMRARKHNVKEHSGCWNWVRLVETKMPGGSIVCVGWKLPTSVDSVGHDVHTMALTMSSADAPLSGKSAPPAVNCVDQTNVSITFFARPAMLG